MFGVGDGAKIELRVRVIIVCPGRSISRGESETHHSRGRIGAVGLRHRI